MPVIVFYKGITPSSPHYNEILLLLLLSIVLAYIFWYFIEKKKPSHTILILLCGIAVFFSALTSYTQGFKEYFNVESNAIDYRRYDNFRFYEDNLFLLEGYDLSSTVFFNNHAMLNHYSTKPLPNLENNQFLFIGDNSKEPSFILIGDSHAFMTYPGLDIHCADIGVSGVLYNSFFAPFRNRNVGTSDMAYSLNKDKYQAFINWIKTKKQIKTIVVIFSWERVIKKSDMLTDWSGNATDCSIDAHMESLSMFLHEIKQIGKKVVIFTPYPRFSTNKMITYARMRARFKLQNHNYHSDYIVSLDENEKKWAQVKKILKEFEKNGLCSLIDTSPYFFKDNECYAIKDNQIIFFDGSHISPDISVELIKCIGNEITSHLKESK